MSSSYPAGLDALSTAHSDTGGTEIIHAATVNDVADAVNKIEAELGTLPKGGSADVKTRIAATETVANAAVPKSTVTTAGDIIYATGSAAVARLGLGAAGTYLKGGVSAPSFAAPTIAELSGYPNDATKFPRGDGVWAAPATAYRKTTSKTVNNTITETDLLNGEITLAANDLGTNKVARLLASGDWLQNSGGNQASPRFKLKLGATTLIDTGAFSSPFAVSSVTRFFWSLTATIAELGLTNAQWAAFELSIGADNGNGANTTQAFTTGEGYFEQFGVSPGSTPGLNRAVGVNSGALDGTGTLALVLSVILPTANAACEIVLKHALVVIE